MNCVSLSSRYFNRFDLSDKDSFFDSKTRSTIVSMARGNRESLAHQQAGPGEKRMIISFQQNSSRWEPALIACDSNN